MSPCSSRTHTPSLRSIAGKRITRLRIPLEEISDQLEAEALALLRVKLRAHHGVATDDRGDRPAVIRLGHEVGALRDLEMVGMHEISVQALRPDGDAFEQRMPSPRVERVPT